MFFCANAFDFSDEMPSITLEFTYVDVDDEGHGANFPNAEIAEKRIDGNNSSWMYLKFEEGIGRHNFGFYDAVNLQDSPSVSFNPSIVDFPDNLTYQSYFTESTNFNASLGNYDLDIEYSFTGFVDGYGSCVLPDGLGTYDFSNGDRYEGEWRSGRRTGNGTYTYQDGSKYVGEWKNNINHGRGTFTSADGRKFVGEFKEIKFWNIEQINKNGNIIKKWINGKIQ